MNSEIIDIIKSKMAEDLLPEQLLKLENVLTEVLETNNKVENCAKDNKYLVKQFIVSVRRI